MTDVQDRLARYFATLDPNQHRVALTDVMSRTPRARRRPRQVVAALVAVAVLVLAVALVARQSSAPRPRIGVNGGPTSTTIASATAAQLAAGHWSAIPVAPIGARDSESQVWTGTELIVWGGEAPRSRQPDVMLANGAAYNPTTRTWRVLPKSPLSARADAVAVWTGSEMVLWGGTDAQQAAAETAPLDPTLSRQVAAVYEPATNTWRTTGVVPLPTGSYASGVWTGDRVMLFAGSSAASYDPTTNRWQLLPPRPSVHHLRGFRVQELGWREAVAAGAGRVVAWAQWEATKQITKEQSEGAGGVDVFVYDESTNRWTVLPSSPNEIPGPEEAFWTGGNRVIVRGDLHIPGASGPGSIPEASDSYDIGTGAAKRLPPDGPAGNRFSGGSFASAWTGRALFSFGPGSGSADNPTNASVYNAATNRWHNLPRSIFGCNGDTAPVWTGTSVLLYCAQNRNGNLEFTPGP